MAVQTEFSEIATKSVPITKESLARVKKSKNAILVGIPKENALHEKRVVLTPEAAGLLINNGQRVIVETEAGLASKFTDQQYLDAGAQVVYSAKEAFDVEVVLKVEPPTVEEISYMRQGSCLLSALQLGDQQADFIHGLNQKKLPAWLLNIWRIKWVGCL